MTADQVAAKLADIRMQAEKQIAFRKGQDDPRHWPEYDMPALLDAVDAVLARHRPLHSDWGDMCSYCWTRGGSRRSWPCPEYLETAAALLGQEDADG